MRAWAYPREGMGAGATGVKPGDGREPEGTRAATAEWSGGWGGVGVPEVGEWGGVGWAGLGYSACQRAGWGVGIG